MRKHRQDRQRQQELKALIAAQRVDQRHDWLLTRARTTSQKTTRHVDDAGRTAKDLIEEK